MLRQPPEGVVEGLAQERRIGVALAGAMTIPRGMPQASTVIEGLMPRFPRSTGLLPVFSPPQGALVMQQSTARSANSRPTRRS